jgi:hypothetical protein
MERGGMHHLILVTRAGAVKYVLPPQKTDTDLAGTYLVNERPAPPCAPN